MSTPANSYSEFARGLRTPEQVREPGSKNSPDYGASRRIRTGKTKSILVPVGVLGRLLRALDDELADYATEQLGIEVAIACMDVAGWEDLQAGAA